MRKRDEIEEAAVLITAAISAGVTVGLPEATLKTAGIVLLTLDWARGDDENAVARLISTIEEMLEVSSER